MTVGDPIRDGWGIYKRFWQHLLTAAFLTYVIVSGISVLLVAALGAVGGLLSVIVELVGLFLLQATLVEAVSDVRDGRADLTYGETLRRGWTHAGSATLAGLMAGLAIAIGLIAFIVPGLYLLTNWCLIIPVIVLDGLSPLQSFGRSRQLVSGQGWTVFSTLVVVFVLDAIVSIVVGLILRPLSTDVTTFVGGVVSNTLVTPFVAATITCLYFRLRDLEGPVPASVPAGAAFHDE